MKKILVIVLAVVMIVGAMFALSACGEKQVLDGTCYYSTKWGAYGCKVKVTVVGDKIKKVELLTDEQAKAVDPNWDGHRTSASWGDGKYTVDGVEKDQTKNDGDLGHDAAEKAYKKWINTVFVNHTVAEVMAYQATQPGATNGVDKNAAYNLQGATQSSARIILAVQDALSHYVPAE